MGVLLAAFSDCLREAAARRGIAFFSAIEVALDRSSSVLQSLQGAVSPALIELCCFQADFLASICSH